MIEKVQRRSLLFTIFSVAIILVVLSCDNLRTNDSSKLNDYFKTKQNYSLTDKTKAVFVLSEEGCMTCNKSFAQFALKYAKKDDVICLLNASGTKIDISPFENYRDNIFYDADNKDSLFATSKVIFLSNKTIDTIVNLNAKSIDVDFKFIDSKL